MNKWSFLLVALLLTSFLSFGQKRVVVSQPVNELVNVQLPSGTFTFEMPKDITSVQVEESAAYYTMYFSIQYNRETGVVQAKMEANDAKSRHILMRFFVTLGLFDIDVNGTIMPLEDYYQMYLD
ncbi:MAG: hypothetical protein KJ941_08230 [Bacteroidetes bacterium]|nr:hypothetical protein [Bacteroidota bacterium]